MPAHTPYRWSLWGAYLLLAQSIVLLWLQSDSELKVNLLLQVVALGLFTGFSRKAAGTYLNAPFVFAGSIFIWHSPFLIGHYFELAPLFAFTSRAFNIGFEFIYKATALVGLSLGLTILGFTWAYRRQLIENESDLSNREVTCACYSLLDPTTNRVAWYLLTGMLSILVLFLVRDGPGFFGKDYLDIYADAPVSVSAVLFFRSQLVWVFVIVVLVACYKDVPRVRNLVGVLVVAVCALLAMLGSRTAPFICLMALLLSWDCFVRRVRLQWILAFILFLSAASYVIGSGRQVGLGVQVFEFADTGKERLDLLDLFHMQGRSIQIVLRTMEFSQKSGLMYGRTLVDSTLSVVPLPFLKLLGYSSVEPLPDRIVDNSPDIPLFEGMGSSLVAEFYDNFGMFGCVGFLIIGWYLGRTYFKYVLSGDIFAGLNAMTVATMYTVMMRNHSGMYWRLLIYGFVAVALLRRKRERSFAKVVREMSSRGIEMADGFDQVTMPT